VRKSVFEVLSAELVGARALDVCAGVGSLGFEALSRGASHCVFVEESRTAARRIGENARRLGLAAEAIRIHRGDAALVLPQIQTAAERFGIAFFDPPWSAWRDGTAHGLAHRVARLEPALLAVEHPAAAPPAAPAGYEAVRTLVAGDGAFTLFRPEREIPHTESHAKATPFVA